MTPVLLVEPEPQAARQLKDWLNFEGCFVELASNGTQAIDRACARREAHKPLEIAFLPLHLSDIHVLRLFRMLKGLYPTVQGVFVGGEEERFSASVALQMEMSWYLRKPLERRDLLDCLMACQQHLAPSAYELAWCEGRR